MTTLKTINLEEINCRGCGITYAAPDDYIAEKRSNAGSLYCPNGCHRGWSESDADRLRKQLEAKERELRESKCETLRQTQLREQEQLLREKADRKLKRVNNGVCPCCKKSFTNLRRHMLTKHAQLTTPAKPG